MQDQQYKGLHPPGQESLAKIKSDKKLLTLMGSTSCPWSSSSMAIMV